MRSLLFISLLLISSTAWACTDYTSCIKRAQQTKWFPMIAKCYSDQALAYATGDIAESLHKLIK